jgi:hypothetical protein
MRKISNDFMDDLQNQKGVLRPILEKIQKDHTLLFAIRENYINVYYRGGNILRLREHYKNSYQAAFDENYGRFGQVAPILTSIISNRREAEIWSENIPKLKISMDEYFVFNKKSEREYQQIIVHENNLSSISNETEYFITDIEYSPPGYSMRLDMLAIQWPASKRKSMKRCRPAIIELKYGASSIKSGKAGLIKHLRDIETLINDKSSYNDLIHSMEHQFDQLTHLDLIKFKKFKKYQIMKIASLKPEVILMVANYNPRSQQLKKVLNDPELHTFSKSANFNLKFFVASFSGYGLHTQCMFSLEEFLKIIEFFD